MHHINELLPQPTLKQTVLFALFCAEAVLPVGAMDEAIEATRRRDYDAAACAAARTAAYAYSAYAACASARTAASRTVSRTAAARAADAVADAAKYAAIYAAKYAANAIDLHAIAVRALAE